MPLKSKKKKVLISVWADCYVSVYYKQDFKASPQSVFGMS